MLQLTINYESKWGNSFLGGDNNSPLPKDGRTYLASLKNLNDRTAGEANFIRRSITNDTVMGVLNRLIGDQRKLYQARASQDYYFKKIEADNLVSFTDNVVAENEEMIYLRNFTKSTDQNAFSGMINANHPAFTSDFSEQLWGVLFMTLDELCDIVKGEAAVSPTVDCCPIAIADQYNNVVSKLKNIKLENPSSVDIEKVLEVEALLSEKFGVSYRNSAGTEIQVYSLYCSALYLQVERLGERYDMSNALTRVGGLPGFSKRGFTYKDFMKAFTTGDGKIVFGSPYYRETLVKGVGKVREMMKKQSGTLTISLQVNDDEAYEIMSIIRNAGVMSFPLGKKGLAYVRKIKVVS